MVYHSIEDEEDRRERIESLRRQKKLCRRNINNLEEMKIKHGANVPLGILSQLDDAYKEMERIERELEELRSQERQEREEAKRLEQERQAREKLRVSASPPPKPVAAPVSLAPILSPTQPFEPEMVLIPAGNFLMGSDPRKDKDARGDEQPQHSLYLPDYYLGKTPVTNIQYAAFVQATGYGEPEHWKGGRPQKGKENHPVVNVSWRDALAYCGWLSKVTGKPYGLPSEAEWEKGARGTDGRIYPWGDGWDARRCNSAEGGVRDTSPVRAYPNGASPYGLLDMAGNVWEWTWSLWGFGYPYDQADGREDLEGVGSRVLRGGAFYYVRTSARCAVRFKHLPDLRRRNFGFRVCIPPASPGYGLERGLGHAMSERNAKGAKALAFRAEANLSSPPAPSPPRFVAKQGRGLGVG